MLSPSEAPDASSSSSTAAAQLRHCNLPPAGPPAPISLLPFFGLCTIEPIYFKVLLATVVASDKCILVVIDFHPD